MKESRNNGSKKTDELNVGMLMSNKRRSVWGIVVAVIAMLAVMFALSCSKDNDDEKVDDDPSLVGPSGTRNPNVPFVPRNINAVAKTEDGNEVLVYREGQLDVPFVKMDTIIGGNQGKRALISAAADDDGYFQGRMSFYNMDPADIPVVGDIMSTWPTGMAPEGFLYKVLSVEKDASGMYTFITVESIPLEEAIEEADFDAELLFEFDEDGEVTNVLAKTARGVEAIYVDYGNNSEDILRKSQINIDRTSKMTFNAGAKACIGSNESFEPYFNPNASKDSRRYDIKTVVDTNCVIADALYTIQFNFGFKTSWFSLKRAKISFEQELNFTAKGFFDYKKKGDLYNKQIKEFNLPTITFSVCGIPIVITNKIDLRAKADADFHAHLSFMYDYQGWREDGWRYGYDGKGHEWIKDSWSKDTLDIKANLTGWVRAGIYADFETALYGSAGVSLHAFPHARLESHARAGFLEDYVYNTNVGGMGGFNMSSRDQTIDEHQIRMDFDLEWGIDVFFKIWKFDLARVSLARETIRLMNIFRGDFLPSFYTYNYVLPGLYYEGRTLNDTLRIASKLNRQIWNYPVHEYGYCIETPSDSAVGCKNGDGIKHSFNGGGLSKAYRGISDNIDAYIDISSLPAGTYHVRPYFTNGIGGRFYYKPIAEFNVTGFVLDTAEWQSLEGGTVTHSPRGTPGVSARAQVNYGDVLHGDSYTPASKAQVTLTAVPKDGYVFANWYGISSADISDGDFHSNLITIAMDKNRKVWPNFVKRDSVSLKTNMVFIDGDGERTPCTDCGTIELSPNGVTLPGDTNVTRYDRPFNSNFVPQDRVVKATAKPAEGYRFIGWEGGYGASGSRDSVNITMMTDVEVTAKFGAAIPLYTFTTSVVPEGGGQILGASRSPYRAGDYLYIEARPASGYRFVRWEGNLPRNYTYSMIDNFVMPDSNLTLTAHFERIPIIYTLTANADGGNIRILAPVNSNGGKFEEGTEVTVMIEPFSNYIFTGWTGASTSTKDTITITMDGNKELTANFTRTYMLIAIGDPVYGGSVTRDNGGSNSRYMPGDVVTVTAEPQTGFEFVRWDGTITSPSRVLTVTMNSDVTLKAIYKLSDAPTIGIDGTVTDPRDGNQYKTVTIGTQTWMAENLNYEYGVSKCKNSILELDEDGFIIYGEDGYPIYVESDNYCDDYGRLYRLSDVRGEVCMPGWRVPDMNDWALLLLAVSGSYGEISPTNPYTTTWAGAGTPLKSTSGWDNDGNGTDHYGFNALPGGKGAFTVAGSEFIYSNIGSGSSWWASERPIEMSSDNGDVVFSGAAGTSSYTGYLYVRCIRDDITP